MRTPANVARHPHTSDARAHSDRLVDFLAGCDLDNPDRYTVPIWLSVIAIALLGASGWLGGKLVYELGVAVEPGRKQRALSHNPHDA